MDTSNAIPGSRRRAPRPLLQQPALHGLLAVLGVPAVIAHGLTRLGELRTFVVLATLSAVLIVVTRPFVGLVLFVGLLYTRPEDVLPVLKGMRLTMIVSVVTLAGVLLPKQIRREPLASTPLNGVLAGLAVSVVASSLPNGNTGEAASEIARLALLSLLVVNLVRSAAQLSALVTAVLLFTAYLAGYSIYLYSSGDALQHGDVLRSEGVGIFGDPNDLAATIVAGFALTLTRALCARGFFPRAAYGLYGAVMVWAILLTNSRGGMLALIAVIAGAFLLFSRFKTLAIAGTVLVAGLFLTFGPSRMTSFENEASANSRFWFWDNGLVQLRMNPFIGVGFRNFPEVNGGMDAHNSFVQCFAELGLPGYFFWIGCLYYALRPLRRRPGGTTPPDGSGRRPPPPAIGLRDLVGARLALSGFLVAAFWLSRSYIPVLFLLIGLCVAAQTAARGSPAAAPDDEAGEPLTVPTTPGREAALIAALCVASLLVIKAMVVVYK